MKFKFISFLILICLLNPVTVNAADEPWQPPKLISLEFSPSEIELMKVNPIVTVNLKVSHPIGIKSEKVKIYLRNSLYPSSFAYEFSAVRNDSPVQVTLKNVTFVGSFQVPTSIPLGVWNISTDPIQGLAPSRSVGWPESESFVPANFRDMPGAENSLLVRSDSDLKFDFQTFVGPAFRSEIAASDGKPFSLNVEAPIWKIGESIDISKYFQMRVKNIPLELISTSPLICQANGTILKLLTIGECRYRVFTSKTNDYLYKELNLFSTITQARTKPELSIPKIENQTSDDLPKTISREQVYSYGAQVIPQSITPNVCIPTSTGITLFSGGKCMLEYSTKPSLTLLGSDIYTQTFEVLRSSQSVQFTLPNSVDMKTKSLVLNATASSGALVTYTTNPDGNCKVDGSTLMLLKPGLCAVTAQQVGTKTFAPVSSTVNLSITGKAPREKQTISCIKGSKKVSVTEAKPKCPKGYSRVR